jgi:hypothetical protein
LGAKNPTLKIANSGGSADSHFPKKPPFFSHEILDVTSFFNSWKTHIIAAVNNMPSHVIAGVITCPVHENAHVTPPRSRGGQPPKSQHSHSTEKSHINAALFYYFRKMLLMTRLQPVFAHKTASK